MTRALIGCAILLTALIGGFFVGALGALTDTAPDWDDDDDR